MGHKNNASFVFISTNKQTNLKRITEILSPCMCHDIINCEFHIPQNKCLYEPNMAHNLSYVVTLVCMSSANVWLKARTHKPFLAIALSTCNIVVSFAS